MICNVGTRDPCPLGIYLTEASPVVFQGLKISHYLDKLITE